MAQLVKNLPTNAGNAGSIPGSGRSPGEGNGNPLQYSCLRNPMDRGAWRGQKGVGHTECACIYTYIYTIVQSTNTLDYPSIHSFISPS